MTYKPESEEDRVALFKYVLDLDMPEKRKKKVFNTLYEEYRITHEMYGDIESFIEDVTQDKADYDDFWAQLDDGQKYNLPGDFIKDDQGCDRN